MEATATAGVAMFPGGIRLVRGGNHHRQNKAQYSIPETCSPPVRGRIRASGFRDLGAVDFYCKPNKGGVKDSEKKMKKKKLKLLRGLSKDLSTLTQMDTHLLGSHGHHISEAAQVLMKHLQQLQAEEKEQMMRKEKEAAMVVDCGSSSESSSSSSDDYDYDDPVIEVSSFRDCATSVAAAQPTIAHLLGPDKSTSLSTLGARGSLAIHSLQHRASVDLNDQANTSAGNSVKRIEVCMGNKCKKSGSPALLEEFGRAVGSSGAGAGAVVGCKCMGKCRDGPNVRLFNSTLDNGADVSVKAPPNPLFLGVALEDVDIIVAKLFAQELGVIPSF